MNDHSKRRLVWRRNERLEKLLSELGDYFGQVHPVGDESESERSTDVLFICGVGRTGTSLLLQYLAASGVFAYPSNLISRFYMAPYLGELIQTLLLNPDFDHQEQFADLRSSIEPISFKSQLGKTGSALDSNEFWYFWRRFFDFEEGRRFSKEQFDTRRADRFRGELAEWAAVAGKPLVMKANIASWNIDRLSECLPHARFLIMRRDPVDMMIALLNARFRFWGNIDDWYGLALPQESGKRPADPYEQVALQVAAFDALVIEPTRIKTTESRYVLDYETFCAAPGDLWRRKIMTPFLPVSGQIANEKWKDYLGLQFEANRAVPDEHSPHEDVSRDDLSALYRQVSHSLQTR